MRFIADLHIHSHYSRATSKDMNPEGIWRWAQMKGVNVIGTGDFTHPKWFKELTRKFVPAGEGLFSLGKKHRGGGVPASCQADVSFILSAEISCIYGKNGRTRKVHAIVLMPDFAAVERLNGALAKIGNLASDGRPILGLDAKRLLEMTLDASPSALFIPAHAWTPHFSVFGAASGFDSLEECFEDLTPEIRAIETGLSSDPAMNWRLSALDDITLVSNSDAHSAAKIGREANMLDAEITYPAIRNAITTRKGFEGTIEFFPEEGKYHYDGHRACGVALSPAETVRHNFLCPGCGSKVTVGVMHRVEKLADRQDGRRPKDAPGYVSIIPLPEIIAETVKTGVSSKKVTAIYTKLLEALGNEFHILLDVPPAEIEAASGPEIARAVSAMREGKVHISPGYDGEYGTISLFGEKKKKTPKGQMKLL